MQINQDYLFIFSVHTNLYAFHPLLVAFSGALSRIQASYPLISSLGFLLTRLNNMNSCFCKSSKYKVKVAKVLTLLSPVSSEKKNQANSSN